ncbi:unnamed protein product [Caenorhabditis auriculariae]|uniref:C2H2-type domain-containing protein n=1 Tax=Caenorhabditis auriculariae TaxID=2777116 RepID=A0A8S1GNI8_9PELO|nr:unnamed protein product [Caenorhabditis auriculariae]
MFCGYDGRSSGANSLNTQALSGDSERTQRTDDSAAESRHIPTGSRPSTEPNSEGAAEDVAASARVSAEQMMSINEHLSSMPMPSWLDAQFRNPIVQRDLEMLNLGIGVNGLGPTPQHISAMTAGSSKATPPVTPNVHALLQRCEDSRGSSSSEISSNSCSSSCSPTTANQEGHELRRNRHQRGDQSSSSDLEVGGARTSPNALLGETESDGSYMNSMRHDGLHHSQENGHRHPMQPMPLHLSFGRCSDGATTGPSAVGTPAPARRTRSANDGMLKCQFCPKKFINDRALHNHMSDCRMIRSHECAQCGRRFKARGGLQQHMRIHSNDKPYNCHFCTKSFTQKSHLDQHERIHTGAKPFTCQFCGRAFRQRSQQMGHEATHGAQSATSPSAATLPSGTGATPSGRGRRKGSGKANSRQTDNSFNGVDPGISLDAAATVAAAAMMQQQQMGLTSDLLGQLETSREMMEGLSPSTVAAHMNMNMTNTSAISSLLALSSPHVSTPHMQHHHHHSHMQPHDMQPNLLQPPQLHNAQLQSHQLSATDFPSTLQMQQAVGLINGLH